MLVEWNLGKTITPKNIEKKLNFLQKYHSADIYFPFCSIKILNQDYSFSNTFKYHVSCTDEKISVITVNCPSQETDVTSTPTRPIENVVITTKGLQDRNIHILDGTTVDNKDKNNKLILIVLIVHFSTTLSCRDDCS